MALHVNGQRVPVKSRVSQTLKAYRALDNRLEASTSSLRLDLSQEAQAPDMAFCNKCGNYVLVSALSVWFEGSECVFFTCGCDNKG